MQIKAFVAAAMALGVWMGQGWGTSTRFQADASKTLNPAQVIRFRVIANSDNPIDQAVKLDVRDAVLRQLEPVLQTVQNRRQALARIRRDQAGIARAANQILSQQSMNYRAHIRLTRTQFPTKAYGSTVLPAGTYRALLVVLGKGRGHNWWCVLYPSLCFIDMANGLAVPYTASLPPKKSSHLTVYWPHAGSVWRAMEQWF